MSGAWQATSHRLKLSLETSKVDEGGHESRHLDVGGDNELGDEVLDRREGRILNLAGWW